MNLVKESSVAILATAELIAAKRHGGQGRRPGVSIGLI